MSSSGHGPSRAGQGGRHKRDRRGWCKRQVLGILAAGSLCTGAMAAEPWESPASDRIARIVFHRAEAAVAEGTRVELATATVTRLAPSLLDLPDILSATRSGSRRRFFVVNGGDRLVSAPAPEVGCRLSDAFALEGVPVDSGVDRSSGREDLSLLLFDCAGSTVEPGRPGPVVRKGLPAFASIPRRARPSPAGAVAVSEPPALRRAPERIGPGATKALKAVATLSWDPGTTIFSESAASMPLSVSCQGTQPECDAAVVTVEITGGSATGQEGGSCAPGIDFLLPPAPQFDDAGSLPYTVTLCNDAEDEPDEDFTLLLRRDGAAQDSVVLQILDDDPTPPPTLMLAWDPGTTVFPEGAGSMPLSVSCQGTDAACQTAMATVTVDGGSATAGGSCGGTVDFVLPPHPQFLGAGSVPYTVALCDDMVQEPDETLTLSLRLDGMVEDTLQLQIQDNEATVTWDPGTTIFDEGAGELPLSISCQGAGCANVDVEVSVTAGPAQETGSCPINGPANQDFSLPPPPDFTGEGSLPYPVELCDDPIDEPDESFTLRLVVNGNPGDTLVLHILDNDDTTAIFRFEDPGPVTVGENVDTVTVRVLREGGTGNAVQVRVRSVDGSATSPMDFEAVDQVLSWAANDSDPKDVTVKIENDTVVDSAAEESFALELLEPTPAGVAQIGSPSTVSIEILDDDTPAVLRFENSGPVRVDENVGTVTVRVLRQGGEGNAVQVRVRSVDGSATSPMDFGAVDQMLSWSPNDFDPKEVTVTIEDDTVVDSAAVESFTLELLEPMPGGVAQIGSPSSVSIEILDDDTPAIFQFENPGPSRVDENVGTVTVRVLRQGGAGNAVQVRVRSVDGSAVSQMQGQTKKDFEAVDQMLSWSADDFDPRDVTVKIENDTEVDGAAVESFTLELLEPMPPPAQIGSPSSVSIEIVDDDTPAVFRFEAPGPGTVDEDAGTVTVRVLRQGGAGNAVQVRVRSVDGSATSPMDFVAVDQVLSWTENEFDPRDVPVTIVDDREVDSAQLESFTLELLEPMPPPAEIGSPSSISVEIQDDESLVPRMTPAGGGGQVGTVDVEFPEPLVVRVQEVVKAQFDVVWTVEQGMADIEGSPQVHEETTNENGRSSVRVIPRPPAGDLRIRAALTTAGTNCLAEQTCVDFDLKANSSPGPGPLTIRKDPATDNQTTSSGGSVRLRVSVNRGGAPASPPVDVDWRVVGGSASLSRTPTRTNAAGRAGVTVTVEASDAQGTVRVRASCMGCEPAAGRVFQINVQTTGQPEVSFTSATVPDAGESQGTLTVGVRLSEAVAGGVSVELEAVPDPTNQRAVAGAACVAGVDFVLPGAMTFSQVGPHSLIVTICDDTDREGDEDFVLRIKKPPNATRGSPRRLTGTIVDDDDGIRNGRIQISGNGQSGIVGRPFPRPLTVRFGGAGDGEEACWEVREGSAEFAGGEGPEKPFRKALEGGSSSVTVTPLRSGPIVVRAGLVPRGSGDCPPDPDPKAEYELSAVDQILEEAPRLASEMGRRSLDGILTRLSSLRRGGPEQVLEFASLDLQGIKVPLTALARLGVEEESEEFDVARLLSGEETGGAAGGDKPSGRRDKLGFFVSGIFAVGDRAPEGEEAGIDFHVDGLTVGADWEFESLYLGGALSYLTSGAELGDDGGEVDAEAFNLASYLLWFPTDWKRGNLYVDAVVSLGQSRFDQVRRTEDLAPAVADYDGDQVALYLATGYEANLAEHVMSGFASVSYVDAAIDSYRETSTEDQPLLEVASQDVSSLLVSLGMDYTYYLWLEKGGVVAPGLRLSFRQELEDGGQLLSYRYANVPVVNKEDESCSGTEFECLTLTPRDSSYFNLALSLLASFDWGSVFLSYDQDMSRSDFDLEALSAGVRFEF